MLASLTILQGYKAAQAEEPVLDVSAEVVLPTPLPVPTLPNVLPTPEPTLTPNVGVSQTPAPVQTVVVTVPTTIIVPVPTFVPTLIPRPTLTVPVPGPTKTVYIPVPGPTRTIYTPGPERTIYRDRIVRGDTIIKEVPVPGPTKTVYSEMLTPGQEKIVEKRIQAERDKATLRALIASVLAGLIMMAVLYASGYRKGEEEDAKATRQAVLVESKEFE